VVRVLAGLLAALAATAGASAADTEAAGSREQVLETVLVTGAQPGPGLWQVVHGDHRMWVLGTLRPIPRDIDWQADEVLETLAQSSVVLSAPSLNVDTGIGMVRGALLLPSLLKVRRNPGRARLADVLPPDLYARWAGHKQRYLPRNRRIERWRPIAAAGELREAAAKASGLVFSNPVSPLVHQAAKDQDIPLQSTTYRIEVDFDKPRKRLRELAKTPLDDHDCFARTLDAIETDVALQGRLANAWAVGDLDELRRLKRIEPTDTCLRAALDSAVFADFGLDYDQLIQAMREHWLDQAERTLAEHATSLALMSIQQVLADDGLLALLAARGYTVIAPDQVDEDFEPVEPVEPDALDDAGDGAAIDAAAESARPDHSELAEGAAKS